MREIKFRAWNKVQEQMVWDELVVSAGGRIFEFNYGLMLAVPPVDDYILMQFTGLKDKNGKEIYEGDLLKLEYPKKEPWSVWQVGWDSELGRWCGVYDTGEVGINLSRKQIAGVEVIGNIYENSELLRV